MFENNKEDILLDYALISLISSKIRVIVIGGGNGGYIKAKSFLKRGCNVDVLSKSFNERFEKLEGNIKLIKDEYKKKYIEDKHIVIISTADNKLNEVIKKDCEYLSKIYLYSSEFKYGLLVTPTQRETKSVSFAVHTKAGSPKTSVFLAQKIKETLNQYDDFINYIGELRQELKTRTDNNKLKIEVMNFINTDDFYYFYKKGKQDLILKLFWRDLF